MSGETTIPLLPCASIDEIEEFYTALGFTPGFRQLRPNPYLTVQRDDLILHFFGIAGFVPEDSYGSCLVLVDDIGAIHADFAAGMRERYGKVLAAGIPRMTRPRQRKNAGGLSGFSIVDPGGNWIRFTSQPGSARTEPADESTAVSPLAGALANAVVLGDSQGNTEQASKILDGALRRFADAAPVPDLVQALIYRAELAVRAGDVKQARETLDRVGALDLKGAAPADLEAAADLRQILETQ